MKSLVTAEDIKQLHRDGKASLTVVPSCTIITPEARDVAKKLGVKMLETDTSASNKSAVESNTRQAIRQAVEAKLPAGEHAPALLEQLIEKAMRELNTPVPYCDREVATNGVILVRGSSVKFGAFDGVPDKAIGLTDVFFIPKGSAIEFGTPDKVRFVYVAYPADWSTSK